MLWGFDGHSSISWLITVINLNDLHVRSPQWLLSETAGRPAGTCIDLLVPSGPPYINFLLVLSIKAFTLLQDPLLICLSCSLAFIFPKGPVAVVPCVSPAGPSAPFLSPPVQCVFPHWLRGCRSKEQHWWQ